MKGKAATGLMVGLLSLILTACTVVDLDANGNPIMPKDPNAKPGYSNQTPQQIAESSWASRVQQPAEKQALSWADMETKSHTVKAGGSESVFVRAGGTVTAFDNSNERERSLTVTINGKPVKVLIGPVLRSNAIRDAAGYRFEEFTNQVQYAQLTKALNRHAVLQLPPVDASWVGKPVQALLAVSMEPNQVNDVVAIQLQQGNP
jgi:predicted lipoprotein